MVLICVLPQVALWVKGMLWAEVGILVLIICKFSNKWTCTRKKEVEGLSCGFEVFLFLEFFHLLFKLFYFSILGLLFHNLHMFNFM